MSMPIASKGQSTCPECISTMCESGLSAILVCENDYPDNHGPHYVKVYLYFVVPPNAPNAFEDPLDERAATIWANLRAAFSDHHIYFVPGFVGCGPSDYYDIIDSEDIGEEVPPTIEGVENLRGLGFMHTDGIDAYIFRDDVTVDLGEGGSSFCIPNSYCYLFGKEGGVIRSQSQIVSHEMGHCLGLLHTYNEGTATACKDINGSDCEHKGDLVCDTPPDDSNYNANGTCTPSPLPSEDFTNIMSLFRPIPCLDHFTPGQGRRMRRYLKQPVGDMDKVLIQDIVITGQVTWSTPMSPGANVIIEKGGHLIIDAPVTMQESAHIYVKSGDGSQNGGQLWVKRTISAACGKMWQGVVVEGWDNQGQTNLYQGKVSLFGAGAIEHARCGVLVNGLNDESGEPLPYATGGIVSAQYPATFRNNIVDVEFGAYGKEKVASFFSGARFITDDDYRGGVAPIHLKLNRVDGVRIIGGQFRDDRTDPFSDPTTRAVGLNAYDSGFRVYGSTHFTGLYEGIHISTLSPMEGTSVTDAEFDACFTGIYGQDNNNFVCSGNTFNLRRPDNYTGPEEDWNFKGIYMEGGKTAFMISENVFDNAAPSSLDFTSGTDILSIGTMNHSIFDNEYNFLYFGNRARGLNATSEGLIFSGLMYECNIYEGQALHDHLVESGSIRLEQGRRDPQNNAPISAGNRYNEALGFLVAQQFTNDGAGIFYHHILNTPQALQDTDFFSENTIEPVSSSMNTACDAVECPPPCDTEIELAAIKTQFFQQKQTWTTKTAAYPSITNQTQRQSEADAINRLRLSLDRAGSRIMLHFALDTIGLKKDSVLTWLGHLDTYDADLQLARHYFFTGNYTAADNLLQAIPSQYGLSGDLLAEFDDIADILEILQPRLEAEVPLAALPATLLDSISLWSTDCSAAGALARNILYRNGLRREAECGGGQKASWTTQSKVVSADNQELKVFPNPASDELTVELPKNAICTAIEFIGLSDGRFRIQHISDNYNEVLKINTSVLPDGMYAVLARLPDGSTLRAKVLVTH